MKSRLQHYYKLRIFIRKAKKEKRAETVSHFFSLVEGFVSICVYYRSKKLARSVQFRIIAAVVAFAKLLQDRYIDFSIIQ